MSFFKNLDPDDPNLISTMNRLAMTFQVDVSNDACKDIVIFIPSKSLVS